MSQGTAGFNRQNELMSDIEQERQRLHDVILMHDLSSSEAINETAKIDALIVQYMYLSHRRGKARKD